MEQLPYNPPFQNLTEANYRRFDDLIVQFKTEEKAGLVKEIKQVGNSFILTVELEDQSLTKVWIGNLISCQPKRMNIEKFMYQKGVLNRSNKLVN